MFVSIILPIILAVVVSFVIGMLWYSKVLFADIYQKEMGMSSDSKISDMKLSMLLGILGDVFVAMVVFFLIVIGAAMGFSHFVAACFAGLLVLLGGMLPLLLGDVAWAQKSWKLFSVNLGYRVASLLGMAIVFSLF